MCGPEDATEVRAHAAGLRQSSGRAGRRRARISSGSPACRARACRCRGHGNSALSPLGDRRWCGYRTTSTSQGASRSTFSAVDPMARAPMSVAARSRERWDGGEPSYPTTTVLRAGPGMVSREAVARRPTSTWPAGRSPETTTHSSRRRWAASKPVAPGWPRRSLWQAAAVRRGVVRAWLFSLILARRFHNGVGSPRISSSMAGSHPAVRCSAYGVERHTRRSGSRSPPGASHHARDLEANGVAPDVMFVVALIDLTGRIDEPWR
jgi:hypothetical protein